MLHRRDAIGVGQGLHGQERVRATMPLGGSVGDFDWHVPGVERITDEHWGEIVEVHPSLEVLEEALFDGVGQWAALNFRTYAIEQLQSGDLKFAGPVAMDRALRDVQQRRDAS